MLKTRCHDSEESVRLEVVGAIINAAKKDLKCMTDDLFTIVKERTLDKKVIKCCIPTFLGGVCYWRFVAFVVYLHFLVAFVIGVL